MLDERFQNEIDACRPGSRDIDQPEMSPLAETLAGDPAVRARYEAVQRLDARLVDAFAAVPVPAGLAARLLAGLQQAPAPATVDEQADEQVDEAAPSPTFATPPPALSPALTVAPPAVIQIPPARLRHFSSRRRALAALAASLLVATGLWTTLRSPAAPAESEMTTEAALWFERLGDGWRPAAEAPAGLPLPAAIVARAQGWQALAKTVDRRGVVYRLDQGPKARAVLFVLSARRPGLATTAPLAPQLATGGLTIGAWQSQGLVYVLVVEGDERAYRRFLHPGRQPLA